MPAVFAVEADGEPDPRYQWFFEDQAIPGGTNAVFTIEQTALDDAGSYQVEASNFMGSVRSAVARLEVEVPVTLTQAAVRDGNFHCRVTSAPAAIVVMERSPDLRQWTAIWTNSAPDGILEFTEPLIPGSAKFYRAHIH